MFWNKKEKYPQFEWDYARGMLMIKVSPKSPYMDLITYNDIEDLKLRIFKLELKVIDLTDKLKDPNDSNIVKNFKLP